VLLLLGVYERLSRAHIMARLRGEEVSVGAGLVVHDVGNAASKGLPMGGALGTALRWQICRGRDVSPTRFATMLVAYGIATTFATWLLPLGALAIDLTQREAGRVDMILLAVTLGVVAASALFWTVVLRSDRLECWTERRLRAMWGKLARRIGALASVDPATGVAQVRRELLTIGRRPWFLLVTTLLSQATGALILLVALRGLGVGGELGTTEFFRVFFIAHLAGTFAPTPGGVGVVEASTTGALVAAGVDASTGLAAVLVYRFVTYVIPIALGAVLYAVWRFRGRCAAPDADSAVTEPSVGGGGVASMPGETGGRQSANLGGSVPLLLPPRAS
ncbi:MAG: YbhN family protein, partial [Ilumatobacter sp.]